MRWGLGSIGRGCEQKFVQVDGEEKYVVDLMLYILYLWIYIYLCTFLIDGLKSPENQRKLCEQDQGTTTSAPHITQPSPS